MQYVQPCPRCYGQTLTASHDAERYAREADIAKIRAENVKLDPGDPTLALDKRRFILDARVAETKSKMALTRLLSSQDGRCWLCEDRGTRTAPGTFLVAVGTRAVQE